MSHGLKVIVLAADPKALLRICRPFHLRHGVSKEDVLELVHTSVGEHERRVILDHHRCGWYDRVALGCKKVQKLLSNLFGGVHI